MIIPFLHPAWLGVALMAVLVAGMTIPRPWRRWWVLALVGCGVASVTALLGLIPWTGGLHASAYGFFLFLAMATAYGVTMARAGRVGIVERQVIDMALIALAAGLIGARAFEIIDNWQAFSHVRGRPLPWREIFAKAADFDSGGMVWYGGALCGTTGVLIYAWRARMRLLSLSDLVMPAVLAALALGRIGCFFNGCCFGMPTNVGWAVYAHPGPCHRHPTQIYETMVCALLFAACWLLWRRRRWDGQVTLVGCVGYGIWRIINEELRQDKVMTTFWGMFPASTAQVISIYLLLGTVLVALLVSWYRRRDAERHRLSRLVPGSIHALADRP